MASAQSPIIVLDSGLGGLTVAAAIRRALPCENIIYFGDTAHLPYGTKSRETVTGFVREIIRHLLPHQPKHVVIACNTATALALPVLKAEFRHLPITGVIEPGARAAAAASGTIRGPLIAVIATQATVDSKAYEQAIFRRRHLVGLMVSAAPLLVPIIEDGRDEHDPLVRVALNQYLAPLIDKSPNVLLLGCTHYPVYKEAIARIMGPTCRVIDSAEQCAQDVARKLASSGLLHPKNQPGTLRCHVTDDPVKFQRLAPRFAGTEIELPIRVSADELAVGPQPVLTAAA